MSGTVVALERDGLVARTATLSVQVRVDYALTPLGESLMPAVNAIKTYIENGGRALFMLDPPLKMQGDEVADNAALVKLIASWGITLDSDLVLDVSGMGRLLQLGPEVPIVRSYESQPIVRDMKEVPTAVPIARSLEVKSGDKTSDDKLFSTTDKSYGVTKLSGQITLDPKTAKKGPFVLAATGAMRESMTP